MAPVQTVTVRPPTEVSVIERATKQTSGRPVAIPIAILGASVPFSLALSSVKHSR